jgi:hypothetical protein
MATYKEFRPQSEFDSRIIPSFASADPRYFGFVIILRIWLKQINPPKGRNRFKTYNSHNSPQIALRWTPGSWEHFKQRFLRVVPATWDSAFLLSPPDSYNGLIWPEQGGKRRDLLCGLFIKLVEGERDNPHAVLNVVRLADPSMYFGADSHPAGLERYRGLHARPFGCRISMEAASGCSRGRPSAGPASRGAEIGRLPERLLQVLRIDSGRAGEHHGCRRPAFAGQREALA